ncbi:hypothetical protein BV509_13035 [Rhodovulum sulfidophilum]|nr:hypothetical protein BV509_13035 [Rhodovulum sulfidophilum]
MRLWPRPDGSRVVRCRRPRPICRLTPVRARLPNGGLFRQTPGRDGETAQRDPRGRRPLDRTAIARTAVPDGAGIGVFIRQDVAGGVAAGRMLRLPDD